MVSIFIVKSVKFRLKKEEMEIEELLKKVWGHFSDALKGEHQGAKIWGTMNDQVVVVNGHIKNAEESIKSGDYGAAMKWLESAKSSNSVIEEFEDLLIKLERKELKSLKRMNKASEKMKERISELERDIERIEREKRAAA